CLFFTFLGVVVTPPAFNGVYALTASYAAAYAIFSVPALAVGAWCSLECRADEKRPRDPPGLPARRAPDAQPVQRARGPVLRAPGGRGGVAWPAHRGAPPQFARLLPRRA